MVTGNSSSVVNVYTRKKYEDPISVDYPYPKQFDGAPQLPDGIVDFSSTIMPVSKFEYLIHQQLNICHDVGSDC